MQDYDYVILFDENSQPFIAHSWKSAWGKAKGYAKSGLGRAKSVAKGAARKGHKYLLRVEKAGKYAYAYTKAEADALLGRGKKKIEDAVGITAKNKVHDAFNSSWSARAHRDAARPNYDRAVKLEADASLNADYHSNLLKSHQDTFLHKIFGNISKNEREKDERLEKNAETAEAERVKRSRDLGRMQEIMAVRDQQVEDARLALDKAIEAYKNTPLGKLDTFKSKSRDAVDETIDRAKVLGSKAGEAASTAADRAKEFVKQYTDRYKDDGKSLISAEEAGRLYARLNEGKSLTKAEKKKLSRYIIYTYGDTYY